jgi:hypothetical protein
MVSHQIFQIGRFFGLHFFQQFFPNIFRQICHQVGSIVRLHLFDDIGSAFRFQIFNDRDLNFRFHFFKCISRGFDIQIFKNFAPLCRVQLGHDVSNIGMVKPGKTMGWNSELQPINRFFKALDIGPTDNMGMQNPSETTNRPIENPLERDQLADAPQKTSNTNIDPDQTQNAVCHDQVDVIHTNDACSMDIDNLLV